jgi:hypothetical protein
VVQGTLTVPVLWTQTPSIVGRPFAKTKAPTDPRALAGGGALVVALRCLPPLACLLPSQRPLHPPGVHRRDSAIYLGEDARVYRVKTCLLYEYPSSSRPRSSKTLRTTC